VQRPAIVGRVNNTHRILNHGWELPKGVQVGRSWGGFLFDLATSSADVYLPPFPVASHQIAVAYQFFSRYFACDRWMKRGNRAVEKGARGPHVVESANALHHSITNSPNNLDTGRRGV